MYQVIYSQGAVKQLKKFPKELQQRILNSLERIRIRPHAFVKKLMGTSYYRMRVGDYRVILDIKEDIITIFVIEMGHRSTIYK